MSSALVRTRCSRLWCCQKTVICNNRLIHKNVSPEGSEKPRSTKIIKQYALSRYMQLVKSYEKVLEKKFPTAMHVYRIFMVGIKDFYRDMKYYFKIYRRLSTPAGFKCLTRIEIELYHQMPKDMMRVAPMLILSTLPFANYVVLPLVYLFPRQLLCQHFWTLQQRTEFAMERLRRRLYNYKPVFRCVQAQLDTLKGKEEHEHWAYVLGLLGSGMHPKPEDIVKSIDLFRGDPYHLSYLYPGHVKGLLRMHSMHTGLRRRHRLADQAAIIHEMDMAIIREGGVSQLSQEELRLVYTFSHCYFPGMFPSWLESCYDENRRYDTLADTVDLRVSGCGQKLLLTAASLPNSARIQSTL